MGIRVLVADDDPDIVMGLSDRLKWLGHDVTSACDGQAALTVVESSPVDLVFLDLDMPNPSAQAKLAGDHFDRVWNDTARRGSHERWCR
jgi:CheY-like chemotaxis protein